MIYCDTSLMVTALTLERSTAATQDWLTRQAPGSLCVSKWVVTEFSGAVAMKERRGILSAELKSDAMVQWSLMLAEQLTILPVPEASFDLAARFCEMQSSTLRAADALHLAVAALGGHTLATLDARLAEGAQAVGVRVVGFG